MKCQNLVIALTIITSSCAASEDSTSKATPPLPNEPGPMPSTSDATPLEQAPQVAVASIASARLSQDCPDPKTELAAADTKPSAKSAKMKSKSDSANGALVQPCSQSSVQLAFTGQGAKSARVAIKEVRLVSAEGTALATLQARLPTIWRDSLFVAWDGVLPPLEDQKASYKLSIPNWALVEQKSGSSSFGQMFVLDVDVDIDGSTTTLRSPQFERARPEIIKT